MKNNETIEEAARTYGWRIKVNTFSDPVKTNDLANSAIQDFTEGAKWQQEQDKKLYSEEELREAFRQGEQNINYSEIYGLDSKLTEQEWFEKFKKK